MQEEEGGAERRLYIHPLHVLRHAVGDQYLSTEKELDVQEEQQHTS
jgi:hypothetical protein